MRVLRLSALLSIVRSVRIRRLGAEFFWIILGNAVAVVGSLVGVRILTEFLEPADYGELSLGIAGATLVNQAILGPLGNGALRFYSPAKERGQLADYLRAVYGLVRVATAGAALIVLLIGISLFVAGQKAWVAVAITGFCFAIVSGCNSILNGIQIAARQRIVVAFHQGMESWARLIFACVSIVCVGATGAAALGGYAGAALLILISQRLFLKRIISDDCLNNPEKVSLWRAQIWRFAWPISIFGIFTSIQLASDRWALAVFSTTDDAGMYAALLQLGYYPISTVTGVAVQFLAPIFYQRAGDASDNKRNAAVNRLSLQLVASALAVTGLAFLPAFLFHVQIFSIFAARQYASVSHLLPWVVLAGGIFAAGQIIALELMSRMKTRSMMVIKIATAIFGVICNLLGAYLIGISGIVIASILFSALYLCWMTACAVRWGAEECP